MTKVVLTESEFDAKTITIDFANGPLEKHHWPPAQQAVLAREARGECYLLRGRRTALAEPAPPVALAVVIAVQHLDGVGVEARLGGVLLRGRRGAALNHEELVDRGIRAHPELMPPAVGRTPKDPDVDLIALVVRRDGLEAVRQPGERRIEIVILDPRAVVVLGVIAAADALRVSHRTRDVVRATRVRAYLADARAVAACTERNKTISCAPNFTLDGTFSPSVACTLSPSTVTGLECNEKNGALT